MAPRAGTRRGTPADLLVVGLGNPGAEYARTKHNVGAEVVEQLATRHGARLRPGRERAEVAELRLEGRHVVLAVPLTWMNDSGEAVARLVHRYGVAPEQVVIVHDELDLPVGAVRVKAGGGLAGHNGLRSVVAHLHSQEFARVRIGIGKPTAKERGADHVLSRFSPGERQDVDEAIVTAVGAVETIARQGIDAAMNRHNAGPDEPAADELRP
jgi:peptidyl-tRNA hydrolase, PTH1 family